MKTTASIFTKITLGALLAGSIAACNKTKTDDKAVVNPATNKETIVFVNSDSLLNKYTYFKDMSKRLEDKANAAKSDVGARGQAFQREVAEYQKNATTMPADQRQTTEQRLQREQQDLQGYQQNATAQFQNEQATENSKLYDKIADFVKGYAKEKGYKLVLTYSKANPTVLYGDPGLDVTADVAKRLNEAYTKDKK
ncbi:MAG: skp [Mucilaginibacter sp.]|jgi:outer membrane protein|nr:skp [Mucilaginibacter sp.]MDB5016381.1 skp [Mucilaginibacter sp.]MDB5140819.1 skp [Mucilaginibacter sp.]